MIEAWLAAGIMLETVKALGELAAGDVAAAAHSFIFMLLLCVVQIAIND